MIITSHHTFKDIAIFHCIFNFSYMATNANDINDHTHVMNDNQEFCKRTNVVGK